LVLYGLLVGLFVLLGVWVLAARPQATENRALGILLMLTAGSTAAFYRLRQAATFEAALTFTEFVTWYEIPVALLIAVLVDELFLPEPRTRLRWGILGTLGAATVGALVLHGVSPASFHEIAPPGSTVPTGRGGIVPQWAATAKGVLIPLAQTLAVLLAGYAAADRDRSPIQRRQAAVVGIAFAFLVSHSAASAGVNGLVSNPGDLLSKWIGIDALAHLAGLVAVPLVAGKLVSAFDGRERWVAGLAVAAPLVVGAWDAHLYGLFGNVPGPVPSGNTRPFWLAAFAVGLGVAVVRHGLAGVSRVPRRRLARVTAATLGLAVIGAGAGVGLLGLGVSVEGLAVALAGLAVPAIVPFTPLRDVPRRLVDRVLLDPSDPRVVQERVRVYTSALEAASNDTLPDPDDPVLVSLRRELGLTERDHRLLASTLDTDGGDEQPDILLGRYAVDETLANHDTATTWRARDSYLGRSVVVKHVHEVPDDTVLAEAEALGRIQHENVVQVYDARPHDDGVLIVLEHVPGGSLATKLDEQPLDIDQAWPIFSHVLDALEAVNERGLVHGDIKPANVLLTEDGSPKLADFGTARRAEHPDETQPVAREVTPNAAAPEQLDDRTVSTATDVYQAGALLYRMLTGRPPIDVRTVSWHGARARIREGVGAITDERVPEAWRDVLETSLSVDPDERFATIHAFREALEAGLPDASNETTAAGDRAQATPP
jgi:hypothetical protein